MWFPKNPKVLVVDDRLDEIAPLLKIFSLEGIPYVYYDGKEDVPEHPFSSIRLVVLDVELEGRTNSMQDDKTVASTLCTYLNSLIDIENSSYSILFWTKRPNVIENVIQYLSDCKGAPVTYKNMEKPAAIDLNIDYVKSKFFSDFGENTFEFLINWENSITQDATKFINEMSNVVRGNSLEKGIAWDVSMKMILSKLAYSYTGSSEKKSLGDNAILYATNVLNQSFSESLSNTLNSKLELPVKPEVSLSTIARLNSILFITKINDHKVENGKIFYANDEHLHFLLKHKIIKQNSKDDIKSKLVGAVLTPCCDLAHDKFIKDSIGNGYQRILFGLKIDIEDDKACHFEHNASAESNRKRIEEILSIDSTITQGISDYISSQNKGEQSIPNNQIEELNRKIKTLNELKKKIKDVIKANSPENIYITQPFMNENSKVSIIVFHYGTVQTIAMNSTIFSFSFLMKNSLIADLQTKFANHVNRLGTNMIECNIK